MLLGLASLFENWVKLLGVRIITLLLLSKLTALPFTFAQLLSSQIAWPQSWCCSSPPPPNHLDSWMAPVSKWFTTITIENMFFAFLSSDRWIYAHVYFLWATVVYFSRPTELSTYILILLIGLSAFTVHLITNKPT